MRLVLVQLISFFASCVFAFALEPTELSWQPRGDYDSLLINRVEIPFTDNADTWTRLKVLNLELPSKAIKVIIPEIVGRWESRNPKFPGLFAQIFDSLTRPEREVTYYYKNRQLRRYCIRCSTKGTRDSSDAANYWLDGEFLGTWEQAKTRFEGAKWEDNAVVDILFDWSDILTSSGSPPYLMSELDDIFREHQITVNEHRHYRDANDR